MLYTFGTFCQLCGISNVKHFKPDQNIEKFKQLYGPDNKAENEK